MGRNPLVDPLFNDSLRHYDGFLLLENGLHIDELLLRLARRLHYEALVEPARISASLRCDQAELAIIHPADASFSTT